MQGREWEAFLGRAIVPKLAHALAAMDINPNAPALEPLSWSLAWADVMPLGLLAALLERALFPQWQALLYHWLSHGADIDEVTRWYLGWKVRARSRGGAGRDPGGGGMLRGPAHAFIHAVPAH